MGKSRQEGRRNSNTLYLEKGGEGSCALVSSGWRSSAMKPRRLSSEKVAVGFSRICAPPEYWCASAPSADLLFPTDSAHVVDCGLSTCAPHAARIRICRCFSALSILWTAVNMRHTGPTLQVIVTWPHQGTGNVPLLLHNHAKSSLTYDTDFITYCAFMNAMRKFIHFEWTLPCSYFGKL